MGAYNPPDLVVNRLFNSSLTALADDDTSVTDYDKANEFVIVFQIDEAKGPWNTTYSLRWRNVTDAGSFAVITASGEMAWGTGTDLVNGDPITSRMCQATGNTGSTWQNGEQVEGAAVSDAIDLADEYYTEVAWAVNPSGAHAGDQYEFEIYDDGNSSPIGTGVAKVTIASGSVTVPVGLPSAAGAPLSVVVSGDALVVVGLPAGIGVPVAVVVSTGVLYLDDAAANVDSSTMDYSVSTGSDSNRYLIVGVAQEGLSQDSLDTPPTVTYGGQSMTRHIGALSDASLPQRVDLFGLGEAGLDAASGSTISVSGAPNILSIHARSFDNVDQTTPVPETDFDSTLSSTPNPLQLSIAAGDGSAVVSISGCGEGGATASWHSDLIERTEITDGTVTTDASLADNLFSSGQTVACECTWSTQNRAAACALELAPETGAVLVVVGIPSGVGGVLPLSVAGGANITVGIPAGVGAPLPTLQIFDYIFSVGIPSGVGGALPVSFIGGANVTVGIPSGIGVPLATTQLFDYVVSVGIPAGAGEALPVTVLGGDVVVSVGLPLGLGEALSVTAIGAALVAAGLPSGTAEALAVIATGAANVVVGAPAGVGAALPTTQLYDYVVSVGVPSGAGVVLPVTVYTDGAPPFTFYISQIVSLEE